MDTNNVIFQKNIGNFKTFIVNNNLVGTAAGVAIAFVTTEVIKSFVGDIIMPGFVYCLLRLNIPWLTTILPGKSEFDVTNFIKILINFVFIIAITFLFVKFTFNYLLGINIYKKKDQEKEKNAAVDYTLPSPQQEFQKQQQQQQQQQQPTKEHFIGGNGYSFL